MSLDLFLLTGAFVVLAGCAAVNVINLKRACEAQFKRFRRVREYNKRGSRQTRGVR